MSQGIVAHVENKYSEDIEHVHISGGGGNVCYTGSNGQCSISTGWGSFDIYASRYGYISDSQHVSVSEDQWVDVYFTTGTGHELHASIEGIVHNENNDPLSNVMVWGTGNLGNTKYWGCLTKSDGGYSLPINSAGNYIIYCGKNNYDIINGGTYSQSGSAPTSTATVNFTGANVVPRSGITTNPKIATSNRSIIIKDDLDTGYYYVGDDGGTDKVFTKTRKWTGGLLDTYLFLIDEELVCDGYGGSQYD